MSAFLRSAFGLGVLLAYEVKITLKWVNIKRSINSLQNYLLYGLLSHNATHQNKNKEK
jgi:hypothetical protein